MTATMVGMLNSKQGDSRSAILGQNEVTFVLVVEHVQLKCRRRRLSKKERGCAFALPILGQSYSVSQLVA